MEHRKRVHITSSCGFVTEAKSHVAASCRIHVANSLTVSLDLEMHVVPEFESFADHKSLWIKQY